MTEDRVDPAAESETVPETGADEAAREDTAVVGETAQTVGETAQAGDETEPAGGETEPAGGGTDVVEQVRTALRTVTDPELGINIVDLGLVYDIEVDEGSAQVTMTLTSPGCPAGGQILGGAKDAAETVEGVEDAVVSLVWKPFWTPEKMDPKVRAMLGF